MITKDKIGKKSESVLYELFEFVDGLVNIELQAGLLKKHLIKKIDRLLLVRNNFSSGMFNAREKTVTYIKEDV